MLFLNPRIQIPIQMHAVPILYAQFNMFACFLYSLIQKEGKGGTQSYHFQCTLFNFMSFRTSHSWKSLEGNLQRIISHSHTLTLSHSYIYIYIYMLHMLCLCMCVVHKSWMCVIWRNMWLTSWYSSICREWYMILHHITFRGFFRYLISTNNWSSSFFTSKPTNN